MTVAREEIDLLLEARWIAPVEPDVLLEDHALAIDQGRIVDLLPIARARQRYLARETRQLDDHLLIPGLVNLHTHAAMSLMRGLADDLPLMTWLQEHIWPAEAAHVDNRFVLDGSRLACAEMLLGGITCFNDMYFFPEATVRAAREFGMRATIGITTLEFPTAWASDADNYLDKGLAVRETCLDDPLIRFSLAPHAPYTVSNKSFERILTLAEQTGLPIHCHIHETAQEIADSLRQYGQRPLARLKDIGLIGPGFIGVHAVHMDEDDIATLADGGASIAHCPTSNLKLASGFAPVGTMQTAGIRIGLGTDGSASNNRLDLLGEMRLASLLAKGLSGDAATLPARQALRMATLDGANALGLGNEIGSLARGKSADITAIAFSAPLTRPCYDPLSHLVHTSSREAVSHVWIAGKCCVDNKTLRRPSENPAQNDLEAMAALWQNKLVLRHGT